MGITSIAKKLFRGFFESRGYLILNADEHLGSTMRGAVAAISARGHLLTTVIDIGTSSGQWSSLCMDYYPACNTRRLIMSCGNEIWLL